MSEVTVDFETRSDVDLKKRGVGPYFASPHWRVLICCYSIDGTPVQTWTGGPCPDDLRAHIEAGRTIRAFNAAFERECFTQLHKRAGWPAVDPAQFVCSAATAAALSLPRTLAGVGAVLDLGVQKDKTGADLIRKFSMPRRPRKDEDPDGSPYWNKPEDHREDFERFAAYCKIDVETEMALDRSIMGLRPECQRLYAITERINLRGMRIDTQSVKAALALVDQAKTDLDRRMAALTDGQVSACSQVGRLTEWLGGQGVPLDSLAKADLADTLERDDLPDLAREAIETRRDYAKSSTAKLNAMLARADADGRVRHSIVFRAAGTGRYSSRGIQTQNLPRPRSIFDDAHLDTSVLYDAFRKGSIGYLRLLYGDKLGAALPLISDAIRGFIWAAPGHDLLAADYSGIEGAIAAWVAGETWKVRALFDLIADPNLPDMYRRAAAGIFNTTTDILTKKDPRRQVGKVSELSLGYQGGVGAFRSMARNYAMKLRPIFEPAWEAAAPEVRERASERFEECKARSELLTQQLSREEWIGCELVKVGWRASHPAIVAAWKALETAAKAAADNPSEQFTVLEGRVSFLRKRGFLWCRLPSGRCLAYGSPAIREMEVPWADKALTPELREKRPVVTCLGVDSQSGKLVRYGLYGGLLFENVVQAIALDLLDNGIEIAEAAGYPVVGHVHDEIITEVPRGWGSVAEFETMICRLPPWAEGLPLTASGWRGKRYRK
jgi:DNA polymerase